MHEEPYFNSPVNDFFLDSDPNDAILPAAPALATTKDDGSKSDVNAAYATVAGSILADRKVENEDDEFAELDAWFASGAVEIL